MKPGVVFAPETRSGQVVFPGPVGSCSPRQEGARLYCKQGSCSLRLWSNIITKSCFKEGPVGGGAGWQG